MKKVFGLVIPAAVAGMLVASPQATAAEEQYSGSEQLSIGVRANLTSIHRDRFYVDNDAIGFPVSNSYKWNGGLELAAPISNRWALRTFWDRVNPNVVDNSAKAGGHIFGVDALYHFDHNLYAGLGLNRTRVQQNDNRMLRGTVGYRHQLTERFFMRGEFASQMNSDFTDISFVLAAAYALGNRGTGIDPWREEEPAEVVSTVDSDGDGVPDYRDACPNTPRNHMVDERGCTVYTTEQLSEEIRVGFAFDSARVTSDYNSDIRRLADFMKEHADTSVVIHGHTDLIGPADYNLRLSKRRADAVADILVNQHGIARNRIETIGHGMTQPLVNAINLSANEKNRRIEAALSVEIRVPRTR